MDIYASGQRGGDVIDRIMARSLAHSVAGDHQSESSSRTELGRARSSRAPAGTTPSERSSAAILLSSLCRCCKNIVLQRCNFTPNLHSYHHRPSPPPSPCRKCLSSHRYIFRAKNHFRQERHRRSDKKCSRWSSMANMRLTPWRVVPSRWCYLVVQVSSVRPSYISELIVDFLQDSVWEHSSP